MASLAFDGDARIVGDLLPRAGQRVEQARFAGVGIADVRDGGDRAGHAAAAAGSTSIAAACRPRMLTCMRPIPRPSGARETRLQIGRATCRERVCPFVEFLGVDVTLKKKKTNNTIIETKNN